MRIFLLRIRFAFWMWAWDWIPDCLVGPVDWICPTDAELREVDKVDGIPPLPER
jgi:hypothetical protein